MRISVIVPSYRRPQPLRRCLEGLRAQTRRPHEVIVVMHEGDSESAAAATAGHGPWARSRLVRVPRRSAVAALEAGVEAAEGEIVSVTDDDAVPRAEWLERLTRHYEEPSVGAVGGRDSIHHGPAAMTGSAQVVGRVEWFGRVVGNHHLGEGRAREVDFLKGVNLSFRRELWEPIRGLRGAGAEVHWELHLCMRLRRKGWRVVYDPAAIVDHYGAPRMDERQRGELSLEYIADAAHNEMHALLSWLSGWRRAAAAVYGLGVGSRVVPGPVAAADRLLRGERKRLAAELRAAGVGRGLAMRSHLRRRPPRRH